MEKFKRLTDESLMPFGKHKGEELQDVPASYLFWLERTFISENNSTPFANGLIVYVAENRDVLEKELSQKK